MANSGITRREFLAMAAMAPFAMRMSAKTKIPMGLEMYSVRDELAKDPFATVKAVGAMGYAGVEFYAPYFEWTHEQAKEMKKLLDDLGMKCFSTHNDAKYLDKGNIQKTIDLNLNLGSKYVVVASAQPKPGLDGWKEVAESLNWASDHLEKDGLKTGYHNHQPEFTPVDGVRPIEVIAKNTKPTVMLQLDVGTCVEAGSDPVKWIQSNPGRIRSLHVKDWSRDAGKAYAVLFGEGNVDWKGVFAAAESVGGTEYYLMEQEGSRYSQLETAKKCLENYRTAGY